MQRAPATATSSLRTGCFISCSRNAPTSASRCDHYKLDRARLLSDLAGVINGFRKNETDMPGVANPVIDLLDRGWHYATLFFGETQIRTGHLLVAGLKSN